MRTTAMNKPQAPSQSLIENVTRTNRKALEGGTYRDLEMEISLVKSIAIHHQPAEYGIKSANECFNAPPQPWQPGVCPSCPYVKHIDMLFACACHELGQTVR